MTAPGRISPDTHTATGHRDATWLAETTLLGALLHCPARITALTAWLRPHDFADPTHGHLYAAIERLHRSGDLAPAADLPTAVNNLDDAARRTLLHNLHAIHSALHTPAADHHTTGYHDLRDLHRSGATANANQYTRYARIVLETSIRRQLHTFAIHLAPTADNHQNEPNRNLDILPDLAALSAQLHRSAGADTRVLPTETAAPDQTPLHIPAPLPAKLVERAERHLLHAVISHPHWQESGILERLQPADFTAAPHATTWHAIQRLAARGEPIDPVTIAWESELLATTTATHHDRHTSPGLPVTELAAMNEPPTTDTHRAITIITRTAITRHAQHTRHQILNAATDRQLDIHQAVTQTQDATRHLSQQRDRLATTRPPSPNHISISSALDGKHSHNPRLNPFDRTGRTR